MNLEFKTYLFRTVRCQNFSLDTESAGKALLI